ncbi:T6SS immunity protein Tli4 family protein [Pseudoduganella sp. R-31]|uniref:T6SS immunity protein Tli4 family protein n=1 Tax=Pseudoduganella sp. R-31 TaxID=3404060 RepID=UPI003CF6BA6F
MNRDLDIVRKLDGFVRWVFAIQVLSGCSYAFGEAKMKSNNGNSPTKTICVGRFLIDVPMNVEVSLGSTTVGGWDIVPIGREGEDEFNQRVQTREAELTSLKNEKQWQSLERTIEIRNPNVKGKLFVYDRKWQYHLEWGKRVESQAISFEAIVYSMGKTYALSAALRSDDHLEHYLRLAGQVDSSEFGKLAGQPGFCFGEGFVHEPLSIQDHEFVMMFLGIKERPDLAIAISTWAGIDLEAPLLERDKNNSIRQEYANHFKDLGTGERTINGIKGGQVADEVSEPNGTVAYSFQWESAMEKTNLFRPRILLEMDTGNGRPGRPVNSSLSKREALALWNQISSSIRDRAENPSAIAYPSNKGEERGSK